MRTDEEIIARFRAVAPKDWLGTQHGDLISYLSAEAAKPLLVDDADLSGWKTLPRDAEAIKAEILDYMPFAWDKANNNRGISAGRSIDHMSAWLWMLGHDEAAEAVLEYELYGKPQLRAICEAFGWDWRQWDDGRWTNDAFSDGHAPPESVPPLPGLAADTQEGRA